MKQCWVIVPCLLASLACSKKPDDCAIRYLQASGEGRMDEAYELLSKNDRNFKSKDAFMDTRGLPPFMMNVERAIAQRTNYVSKSVQMQGDRAVVTVIKRGPNRQEVLGNAMQITVMSTLNQLQGKNAGEADPGREQRLLDEIFQEASTQREEEVYDLVMEDGQWRMNAHLSEQAKVDDLMARSEQLKEKGQPGEAEAVCREILAFQPHNNEATKALRILMNTPRWQVGPCTVALGKLATLKLPADCRYLPPEEVSRFKIQDPKAQDNARQSMTIPEAAIVEFTKEGLVFAVRIAPDGFTRLDAPAASLAEWKALAEKQIERKGDSERASVPGAFFRMSWNMDPAIDPRKGSLGFAWRTWYQNYMPNNDGGLRGGLLMGATENEHATFVRFGRQGSVAFNLQKGSIYGDKQKTVTNMVGTLAFPTGQNYKDIQKGDPESPVPLQAWLTNPEPMIVALRDPETSDGADSRLLDTKSSREQMAQARRMDVAAGGPDYQEAARRMSRSESSGCLSVLLKCSPLLLLGLGALLRKRNSGGRETGANEEQ